MAQSVKPAGDPDAARFAEARNQLVSVAQWLARVERSYASRVGQSELKLRWLGDRNVIATHDFDGDVGLELKIDGLVMQFTEKGLPSDHEIDVEERSPAHIEAWILIELLHRGIDRDRFSKDLPYDTSELLSGDGVEFSPGEYQSELRALAELFRNAVSAVERACDGDVAISPRDLCVRGELGGRAIGFSLGDARIGEPYFYVEGDGASPDPRNAALAILRLSEVSAANADGVIAFFDANGAATRH